MFALVLEHRQRPRGGALQGRCPAAGHGSRSPPVRWAAAGRSLRDLSRRGSRPGQTPHLARPCSPRRLVYTLHFFALFQDNAGKLRSAAISLLVNISHPRFPLACAICHECSHTECNCGWGEAPRCQRSPPLRVDGRPILACGLLRGD